MKFSSVDRQILKQQQSSHFKLPPQVFSTFHNFFLCVPYVCKLLICDDQLVDISLHLEPPLAAASWPPGLLLITLPVLPAAHENDSWSSVQLSVLLQFFFFFFFFFFFSQCLFNVHARSQERDIPKESTSLFN